MKNKPTHVERIREKVKQAKDLGASLSPEDCDSGLCRRVKTMNEYANLRIEAARERR